jgi:Trp operon repressor
MLLTETIVCSTTDERNKKAVKNHIRLRNEILAISQSQRNIKNKKNKETFFQKLKLCRLVNQMDDELNEMIKSVFHIDDDQLR